MTRYRYRATDSQGKAFVDIMEATSSRNAVSILRERGLTVNHVEAVDAAPKLFRLSRRLTLEELHLFVQQLHAITRSALPLPAALRSLSADLRGARLKRLIDALRTDIENGVGLDEAIEKQYDFFPPLFADIVRAGMATGNLAGVLQLYLAHTERLMEHRNALRSALAYPVMVLAAALLALVFLLRFVLPDISLFLSEFYTDLPRITLFWISAGRLASERWGAMVAAGGAFIAVAWLLRHLALRTDTGRQRLDALRMRVPVFGALWRRMTLARFARTLAMLMDAKAPAMESLELAAATGGSALLQQAVEQATLRVAGGERLADALASTGFFPYHFCWLVGTGEDRGEVNVALNAVADSLERDVAFGEKIVERLIGPVGVVLVSVLVLSIIVAIYAPLVSYHAIVW